MTPVAQKGAQNHQAVLHAADDLCCAVSSEQQLSTVLKTAKCEGLVVPLGDHQLQLLLDISFFYCTDTDILQKKTHLLKRRQNKMLAFLTIRNYLNFLFIFEQRRFHDIAKLERISFHLEVVPSHLDTKPNEVGQFNLDTEATDLITLL